MSFFFFFFSVITFCILLFGPVDRLGSFLLLYFPDAIRRRHVRSDDGSVVGRELTRLVDEVSSCGSGRHLHTTAASTALLGDEVVHQAGDETGEKEVEDEE